MEPKEPQVPKKAEVINLADERIARNTGFGPLSKFQRNPENRIIHQSVKKDEKK